MITTKNHTTMKTSEKLRNQLVAIELQIYNLIKDIPYEEWKEYPQYKHLCQASKDVKYKMQYWECREVKAYCNHYMYSDVHPYEVIRVISDQTVEVRAMKHTQIRFPQDVRVGGFSAHTVDNRTGQEYTYESNPEASPVRVRWSEANRQWQKGKHMRFVMSDKPIYFYDYNF